MDTAAIYGQLNKIFEDILDKDSLNLGATTSASDIEEWDSLSHIQLVVAIEKHFKVRFNTAEIQKWKNVGDMVTGIETRLKG